ncbi:MAG: hypothetical protein V4654_00885 [Bdellovibrionota bacterium]
MLKNSKRIDLVNIERDKSFRILADVKIDGKDVADFEPEVRWLCHFVN